MNSFNQLLLTYDSAKEALLRNNGELIQCVWAFNFKNNSECISQSELFFEEVKHQDLIDREQVEHYYYNMILNGLKHKIGEVDYSSDVLLDNRRIVFTNDDCISFIQFLIRDKIYLTVNLRSSDFLNALPSDIKFFCKIPKEITDFLTTNFIKTNKKKENINIIKDLNEKEVQLLITFGSLHIRS